MKYEWLVFLQNETRIFQSHQQETLCKPCKKTFKTPWMSLNSQPLIYLGSHQKPLRKGLWRRKGARIKANTLGPSLLHQIFNRYQNTMVCFGLGTHEFSSKRDGEQNFVVNLMVICSMWLFGAFICKS